MSSMFDPHSNFGYSTVQAGSSIIGSNGSPKTIVLASGLGASFPSGGQFNVLVWPPNARPLLANAEIIRVTRSSDTLTTTARGQEGTTALSTIAAGYQVMAAVTKKWFDDIEGPLAGVDYVLGQAPTTTPIVVQNTIAETDFFIYTIPANTLSTNKELRLLMRGDWIQFSGGNSDPPRFRVYLGGVVYLDTGDISSANITDSDNQRYGWRLNVGICMQGVASSELVTLEGTLRQSRNSSGGVNWPVGEGVTFNFPGGLPASNRDVVTYEGQNTAGIDLTSNQALRVTVQLGTAVTCDITAKYASVAVIG